MLSTITNSWFVRIMVFLLVLWGVVLFYPFATPSQPPETFLAAADTFPERWVAEEFSNGDYEKGRLDHAAAAASQLYIIVPNPALRRNDHVASHRVGSFRSLVFAQLSYKALLDEWFIERSVLSEWTIPTELANVHSQADESRRGCARASFRLEQPVELCVVVARYGLYVSEFWYMRDVAGLTSAEVNTIFTTIDTRFTQ